MKRIFTFISRSSTGRRLSSGVLLAFTVFSALLSISLLWSCTGDDEEKNESIEGVWGGGNFQFRITGNKGIAETNIPAGAQLYYSGMMYLSDDYAAFQGEEIIRNIVKKSGNTYSADILVYISLDKKSWSEGSLDVFPEGAVGNKPKIDVKHTGEGVPFFNGMYEKISGGDGSSAINGVWNLNITSGTAAEITISGSSASIKKLFPLSCLNPNITLVSAVKKGIVKTGTPYLKNIKSSGNNTWSCQMMAIEYNSVPEATGLLYLPATFTLLDNGTTIGLSFDSNLSLRAGTLSKTYINNGCK